MSVPLRSREVNSVKDSRGTIVVMLLWLSLRCDKLVKELREVMSATGVRVRSNSLRAVMDCRGVRSLTSIEDRLSFVRLVTACRGERSVMFLLLLKSNSFNSG